LAVIITSSVGFDDSVTFSVNFGAKKFAWSVDFNIMLASMIQGGVCHMEKLPDELLTIIADVRTHGTQ
jgi:hypothetical protein